MGNYTIEDLRGKYVKASTPEAEVFLKACADIGINWASGRPPFATGHYSSSDFIIVPFARNSIEYSRTLEYLIENGFSEFKPLDQWTIHNNEKPSRELTDEQYGKLRRAADAGGVVELLLAGGDWCDAEPDWCDDLVYRIKQKSEREVFVEKCVNLMTSETERFQDQMFAEVFDAIRRGDIKAPEVVK